MGVFIIELPFFVIQMKGAYYAKKNYNLYRL